MQANEVLAQILETSAVQDAQGNSYPLNSHIDKAEGDFLTTLIEKYQPKKTLEVGFAYGISALYITDALAKINGKGHHTIIDPCQSDYFKGIGIANLKRAGIDFYELHESVSEIALPRLLSEGRRFDLALIDGDHRFEYTLIDFFYLNRMMNIGGIIVFDDCQMASINKAIRYILNYPAYKVIGHVPVARTMKREFFDIVVKAPLHLFAKLLPQKLKYELLSGSVIKPDKSLQLNTSMLAIQKVAEDTRGWDWYVPF